MQPLCQAQYIKAPTANFEDSKELTSVHWRSVSWGRQTVAVITNSSDRSEPCDSAKSATEAALFGLESGSLAIESMQMRKQKD